MKKDVKMSVTGWTNWEDDNYISIPDEFYREAYEAVVNEMKQKGYKFCGFVHQQYEYGCPILNNKYKFNVSTRMWGGVMADAYDLNESEDDAMAYVLWAWAPMIERWEGGEAIFEEEIVPTSQKGVKYGIKRIY